MRIFLSSVIRGFEAYRDAAARAARALRHEVKRAEDVAASSATPQQACLAGVRWANAVILLLGERYGDRQASGVSPTHEEYREARERCPVLIFVERGVTYEPAQRKFLREVQGWTTGHYTASFSDADELRDAVTSAPPRPGTRPCDRSSRRRRDAGQGANSSSRPAQPCAGRHADSGRRRRSAAASAPVRGNSRPEPLKRTFHARRCSATFEFSTGEQVQGARSVRMPS